MSQVKANSFTDASGGSNAVLYGVAAPANSMGFRNRIINGAMVIAQRGTAAVTQAVQIDFPIDRFSIFGSVSSKFTSQQNAGTVTPPTGFTDYLGITSSSAYTAGASELFVVRQLIEGFNVADLGWGAAGAQAATLSFWVRSSLTGTFGGAFRNSDGTRSYPFSFTISAANTWEQKTVTVAGDTSGTWLKTNGIGIQVVWGLGCGSSVSGTAGAWAGSSFFSATGATSVVGTSGATFYITGVQLEAGSVASPFERRDYGRELLMCQRYAVQLIDGINQVIATGQCFSTVAGGGIVRFPVEMRAAPTITASSSSHFSLTGASGSTSSMGGTNFIFASTRSFLCEFTGRSGGGLVAGDATTIFATDSAARLLASAEL